MLWAEEDLPLAAALQILAGKTLYRDAWFDKPPLLAAVYLLWGAHTGWALRVAGAVYGLAAAFLAVWFTKPADLAEKLGTKGFKLTSPIAGWLATPAETVM